MEEHAQIQFKKLLLNKCSPQELDEILETINSDKHAEVYEQLIVAQLKAVVDGHQISDELQNRLNEKLPLIFAGRTMPEVAASKVRKIRLWSQIVAAAAAIALIVLGVYFYNADRFNEKGIFALNDIHPGKNTATLTLANGKVIKLSDTKTGVAVEASVLKYSDGSLVRYASGSQFSGPQKGGQKITGPVSVRSLGVEEKLTMRTPKGGTYQILLPDGTRVWLNAATSLKFPATFAGLKERSVELEGEAYFEVSKDKTHPFIVRSDRQEIKVLGTHFNVNAYPDEASIKTALLEGSVQINRNTILKPGEESSLLQSGDIAVSAVNVNKAVAWKNGKFVFEQESIYSIMKKLSRWYDVEVVYQGDFSSRTFTGSISRNDNISKILEKIVLTGAIHFKIEGRRITVMP